MRACPLHCVPLQAWRHTPAAVSATTSSVPPAVNELSISFTVGRSKSNKCTLRYAATRLPVGDRMTCVLYRCLSSGPFSWKPPSDRVSACCLASWRYLSIHGPSSGSAISNDCTKSPGQTRVSAVERASKPTCEDAVPMKWKPSGKHSSEAPAAAAFAASEAHTWQARATHTLVRPMGRATPTRYAQVDLEVGLSGRRRSHLADCHDNLLRCSTPCECGRNHAPAGRERRRVPGADIVAKTAVAWWLAVTVEGDAACRAGIVPRPQFSCHYFVNYRIDAAYDMRFTCRTPRNVWTDEFVGDVSTCCNDTRMLLACFRA